ncbi:hypothetical protein DPSP01_013054 [Paraphaeosphaeria sporulosa]|uniref:Uncharacterized protein n=1 Tax=Paraphaeosphaeria sporulosa TaxID=1460663 RepID=A0A177BYW0_9PLEO|nr:uncharacterized protein CC84DRAFT_1222827 [Paraphaeosphaeria sporulosa]OAF99821.1 hypothetical protein CC84DRAFT_1222827 [Paraphaeosphaeria sporulosa]
MSTLFRKGGIPALVSSPFDHASPCRGTLVILVNERARLATVELQFELAAQGCNAEQRMRFVYDADNFEPGTTTVSDAPLAGRGDRAVQLAQIARPRGGKLKALGLVLKQPCVVLSPAAGPLSANDAGPRFEQLAALARATRVDIVFDYAWLHPDKRAQFECLVGSSGLTGFPRRSGAVEADWTVFGERDPPRYEESLKRPRQSPSTPPQAPRPKRLLLDDANADIDPGSPTEKATTDPSSPPAPPDPLQAAETAMAKLLPSALRDVLPEILADVLPGILTNMFAAPTPTPSLAHPSTPPPGPPNPLSPLHRVIRARLHSTAATVAEQISAESYAHALEARDHADLALDEQLEDQRLEFAMLKEDQLMEMRRLCDERLEDMEGRCADMVASVEGECGEAYTTAKERISELVGELRGVLVRERLGVRAGVGLGTRTRAASVPLDVRW